MIMTENETRFSSVQESAVAATMTAGDFIKMQSWLGVGTESFRAREAKVLTEELTAHQENTGNGMNRALVLVMACLVDKVGNWQDGTVQGKIMEQLIKNLGGEEQAQKIIDQGDKVEDGIWKIKERPITDLAEKVEKLVDNWYKIESDSAKLEEMRKALVQTKAELVSERQETAGLRKQITEGENIGWGRKRREKAEGLNESLSKPVKEKLDDYIKQFDEIKEVGEDEIRLPQNLAEIDKVLLERFEDCPELDIQELFGVGFGLTNIQAVHLSDILRFRLEVRRNDQAEQRQKNKEKKEVRDYFDTHDLKLVTRSNREGFSVAGELAVQFKKAQRLGVDIFDQNKGFFVETGLDEVTGITLMLGKQGNLIITKVEAKTLGLEIMANPELFRDEMIAVFGTGRKQENQTFRFIPENEKFVIKFNQETIGTVEVDKILRELRINWIGKEEEHGFDPSWFVADTLNRKWSKDEQLVGLELKAVSKEEVKKAPEKKPAPPEPEPIPSAPEAKPSDTSGLETVEIPAAVQLQEAAYYLNEYEHIDTSANEEMKSLIEKYKQMMENVFGTTNPDSIFRLASGAARVNNLDEVKNFIDSCRRICMFGEMNKLGKDSLEERYKEMEYWLNQSKFMPKLTLEELIQRVEEIVTVKKETAPEKKTVEPEQPEPKKRRTKAI
ncbi:MAG: hypothetical protein V1810_02905 [Candidatus Beckwithbacteria bacterium]